MEEEKLSYYQIESKKKAYFVILWTGLLSIFTIGLLFPIANYYFNRYFIQRKYIDKRQLFYKGKIGPFCLIFYIGIILLVGFLVGIQIILRHFNLTNSIPHQLINAIPGVLGTLFIKIWVNKYNQAHTHFADIEEGKSGFKFRFLYFIGKYVLTKLIQYLSLLFLYPISTRLSVLYDYKRGYIDGYRFSYRFNMKKTYPRYLLDLLLSVITIGLYIPLLSLRRMMVDQELVHILKEENAHIND